MTATTIEEKTQTPAGRNTARSTMTGRLQKDAACTADPRAGKYLTFHLGKEEFGIQVLKVKEIMGVQDITSVPGTPAHLKGVINLRGKIIPVVDLRVKFAFPEAPFTQTTCIVVAQIIQEGEQALIGLIVDGVSEVLSLNGSEIEDAPDFGKDVETPFVLGIAKLKGSVKILLKIEEVLTLQELRGVIPCEDPA